MNAKKKRHYKFMEEGHAGCSCCKLEYWQSGVLGGLTIVLVKKDSDNGNTIDIPISELKNLKRIVSKIIKEII